MASTIPELSFSLHEIAALRQMQILMFSIDLSATKANVRPAKRKGLDNFIGNTTKWAESAGLDNLFQGLAESDLTTRIELSRVGLQQASADVRASRIDLLALELVASTRLPEKCKWAGVDFDIAGTALYALSNQWATAMTQTEQVRRSYKRALKRLGTDSSSPAFRLALVTGSVAVGVASGGIATAVGTAIGGAMGLSGAAATSAGLALLGGGSLAAGGFGMAGGATLVTLATKGTYAGSRYLATRLATSSPEVFLTELAKLQVVCGLRPSLADAVRQELRSLLTELEAAAKSEPKDRRNVNKSILAVEATLRQITDTRTQRNLRLISRALPVYGMNKQIDRLRT